MKLPLTSIVFDFLSRGMIAAAFLWVFMLLFVCLALARTYLT